LKKLKTVKKYEFNKLALTDMWEHGVGLMGDNIGAERQKIQDKERRREAQEINGAVNHFKDLASKRQEVLQAVTKTEDEDDREIIETWKREYQDIIS
jgi:hypothetical protein